MNRIKMDIAAIPGFANSLKSYEEYNSEKTRDGIREKYEKLLASKDELEAVIKDTYAIGDNDSMLESEQYDDGFELDALGGTIAEDDAAVEEQKNALIVYLNSTPELSARMQKPRERFMDVYSDRHDTINLLKDPGTTSTDDDWDRMLYFAAKQADTHEMSPASSPLSSAASSPPSCTPSRPDASSRTHLAPMEVTHFS